MRAKQSMQHAASRLGSPARFPSGAPRVFPTLTHTIKTNYIVPILICCTITMFSIPFPNIDGDGIRGSSHTAGFGPGPLCLQPTPPDSEHGRAILLFISSERHGATRAGGVILPLHSPAASLGRNTPSQSSCAANLQPPKGFCVHFSISGGIPKGEGKGSFSSRLPMTRRQRRAQTGAVLIYRLMNVK